MLSTFTQRKYTADTWILTLPTQPAFPEQTSLPRSSKGLERERIIHSGKKRKKRKHTESACPFAKHISLSADTSAANNQAPIQLDSIISCCNQRLNMSYTKIRPCTTHPTPTHLFCFPSKK